MRVRIYPYKVGSVSARALAQALGGLCVRPDGAYRPRREDKVINWGNSVIPNWWPWTPLAQGVLNEPQKVRLASNKLLTLQKLEEAGVAHVPFTTDSVEARTWPVAYCREKLTGHSGEGIVIFDHSLGEIPPHAPLYTKAIDNNGEYRVHVFNGEVIDYRKKSRQREDAPTEAEKLVRNLASGWVYREGHLKRLDRVEQLAKDAIEALGLDFGAVDIIMDGAGEVYVLEVNTACGMEPRTLAKYVEAIKSKFNI